LKDSPREENNLDSADNEKMKQERQEVLTTLQILQKDDELSSLMMKAAVGAMDQMERVLERVLQGNLIKFLLTLIL